MTLNALIFDLDGTLVDSLPDIAAALNHALHAHELPTHSLDRVQEFVGDGVEYLIARGVPAERPELRSAVLTSYRARYAEQHDRLTRPYPGILQLLQGLTERQIPFAVLSNKPNPATQAVVANVLPGVPFAFIAGERPGKPRKPDPTVAIEIAALLGLPPDRCGFVGDTGVDMRTGAGAGMTAIGVTWGYRGIDDLQRGGAHVIVGVPDEILRLVG
ncbi:MAG: HAD family hydrolase [Myxococcota bacterium]